MRKFTNRFLTTTPTLASRGGESGEGITGKVRSKGRLAVIGVSVTALIGGTLVAAIGVFPAGAVNGPANNLQFTQEPSATGTPGVALAVQPKVTIYDSGANTPPSSGATDSIQLSITPGSGAPGAVLSCTGAGNTVAAVAGVATFAGCSINMVGSYTLTATDISESLATTAPVSTPATVESIGVGAPVKLAFTYAGEPTPPTSATTGYTVAGYDIAGASDVQPEVQLEDQYGNLVSTGPDASDTVTLTGPSTLSCPSVALVSGVASFPCYVLQAGVGYTLTATDATHPAITPGVSTPFTISSAAETQLVFLTQPAENADIGANAPFDVSVAQEDQYGNIVLPNYYTGNADGEDYPADTVEMAFTGGDGSAVLSCGSSPAGPDFNGPAQVVTANGVAYFSLPDNACSLNLLGTGYSLTAESDYLESVPSVDQFTSPVAFNIVASAAPTTVTTLSPTSVTTTSATLNGSVATGGNPQSCYFLYGTNPTVTSDAATGSVAAGSVGTEPVSIPVGSLTPGDTYYYALVCNGVQGNTVSFVANVSAVSTTSPTSVTTTSATLNGFVVTGGVAQTCYFLYGTNPTVTLDSATGSVAAGSVGTEPVSISVFTLISGETYYYALVCNSVEGNTVSFVASVTAVTTTPPTLVATTTATLNGDVVTGGVPQTCYFLYGTNATVTADPATGSVAAGDVGTEPVSISVATLVAGDTYYYALVCNGVQGNTVSFVASATGTPLPIQIYGTDAIGTSIATSLQEFPTSGSAGAVVLARDDFFSDGLTGGPLAAAEGGPLLLTEGADESASLDPRTQAEIQRVLAPGGTVYILGGDLAISSNVDATLTGLGFVVVREAGANEYATGVDVANQIALTGWGTPSTVFEATGLYFYDALSSVPAAILEHAAILLTDGSSQAPETAAYLAAHPGDTRYTVGGALAAEGADPTAINISGADLFSTSAAIAGYFFPNAHIFGVATATDFPDALGGGVFMETGGRSGALLLVNPTAPLPPEITPYLASLAVGTQGYVFGGPLAVNAGVLTALQAAVG